MRYLITGNLGYIGPVFSKFLKKIDPTIEITGYDVGFFTNSEIASEMGNDVPYVDKQIFGDVRDESKIYKYIDEADHVIHLAAISNDPMGQEFEKVTKEINQDSSLRIANIAIETGCKSFVFASSCSVYGIGNDSPRNENDPVNPLTAYAKSKVGTEESLKKIKNLNNTSLTCLRFATACGFSPNLRLDLVLNDFVATALASKEIKILSDGSPWRPLIDVEDMSRALYWASIRGLGNQFEILNTGSNLWNYQVCNLAYEVKKLVGKDVKVSINRNAAKDKRSYRVNFDKFLYMADNYSPKVSLEDSVKRLIHGIGVFSDRMTLEKRNYLLRLYNLRKLKSSKKIDENLRWIY